MPQGVQPAAMMMAPQQHVVTMAPQQQPMFMMPGAQGLMGQQGFYLQNAAALQMYAGAMQQIRAPGMVMPGGMPGILPVPGVTLAAPPPLSTAPLPAEGDRKRPLDAAAAAHGAPAPKQQHTGPPAGTIPQRDGPADDAPAGPSEGAPGSASVGGGGDDLGDDDEDDFHAELNEGDDLADVDDHGEIDEESITNVVLGQFDKVQRSKAKWRINLKNCVATLKVKGEDGREETRDYVFKKVTGEMNFS